MYFVAEIRHRLGRTCVTTYTLLLGLGVIHASENNTWVLLLSLLRPDRDTTHHYFIIVVFFYYYFVFGSPR